MERGRPRPRFEGAVVIIMRVVLHTVRAAIAALIATFIGSTLTLIIAIFRSNARSIDHVIRWWARAVVRGAGIDLHVEGAELIDPNQRYILIANHYSYFDIPSVFAAIRQPIRFMAKVSLFKIPLFGWALGRAGFIPIDRKNRRTAVQSFDLAVERIRKGNTIVIFPEEGRSRERAMRPFQRGGFLLALKSGLPILPVAIDGTFDVFRAGATRVTPGRVTVRVGIPIPTEGLTVRAKGDLLQQSRAQISRMLFGDNPPQPANPTAAASEDQE